MSGALSIGVAGALGPEAIAALAPTVERLGFAALWVNDTPGGDALAALAAAARTTSTLILAAGVVPIDRRPAADIARAVTGLPAERLWLGVGAGGLRAGALARVGDAVEQLRATGAARVLVGALGPRMRRLGAEQGDGVLLNWVPADAVADQRAVLRTMDPAAHVAVYVRTALDPVAGGRLAAEAERYGSFPAYARHFARLGVAPIDTAFDGEEALRAGLAAYRGAADEVVLRAVTVADARAELEAFAERAAVVAR